MNMAFHLPQEFYSIDLMVIMAFFSCGYICHVIMSVIHVGNFLQLYVYICLV